MLLLRYQRQRQEEDGGHRSAAPHDMRRKFNDYEIKGESRRAATRGTLICIFVCGSLLLSVGITILCVGLLVARSDNTPWLVIGPTCIILGILVLLLSVEIIMKLRKIAASSGEGSSFSDNPKKESRQSWGGNEDLDSEEVKPVIPKPVPVVIHPATPIQPLDPAALPGIATQHS